MRVMLNFVILMCSMVRKANKGFYFISINTRYVTANEDLEISPSSRLGGLFKDENVL